VFATFVLQKYAKKHKKWHFFTQKFAYMKKMSYLCSRFRPKIFRKRKNRAEKSSLRDCSIKM